MDAMWNLLWILFLLSAFMPLVQARLLELARLRFLRRLERQRRSRVITLIHRQEPEPVAPRPAR